MRFRRADGEQDASRTAVGWSKVGPAALGLPASTVDFDGNYIIKSPITGTTYSGPQHRSSSIAMREAISSVFR